MAITGTAIASSTKEVGPLTVQVVDSETKQPIAGIVVYYGIGTVRPRHILWFAWPDNARFEHIDCRKLITDEHGMIAIERRHIHLRWDEELEYEEILVNMDSGSLQRGAMEWGPATKDLHCPNKAYRAADIQICFFKGEGLQPEGRRWEKLDTIDCEGIWRTSESQRKDSERIVVELVRCKD